METLADEVQYLRRCIRDLVAFTTLPAVWTGREPQAIAESLAEVLLHTLRLDIVYVRVRGSSDEVTLEAARAARQPEVGDQAQAIGRALAPWLTAAKSDSSLSIPNPTGSGTVRLTVIPIGYEEGYGMVAAGSQQSDFPTELDRLLLNVGANQVAVWLKEARLLAALQRSKEAERAQREFFQVTLASIGDAVIVTDPEGAVTFLNQVAEAITGWTTAKATGKPLPEVFRIENEETRHPVENPVTKVLREGGVVGLANHTVLVRKDGSVCPIDDSAAPIRDEHGRLLGIILVFRDITTRKQVETERERLLAELQRINAELQQFSYTVSHDLNEPLRTISNFLQLFMRRSQGKLDGTDGEYLAFVVDGAQRMQQMITDLLAYTRVGGPTAAFVTVDSEALLTRVLSELQVAIADAKGEVTYDLLPTVQGDETRLGQVFQNLIGNALKFCKEMPRIHISAQRDGQHWRFAVRDNGIGIDPAQIKRLFQVFQRLHTRSEYPGTGIGLAICKKIVERHGGRIWVESQPGKGATFYFTIPEKQLDKG